MTKIGVYKTGKASSSANAASKNSSVTSPADPGVSMNHKRKLCGLSLLLSRNFYPTTLVIILSCYILAHIFALLALYPVI